MTKGWKLDSGATQHISSTTDLFSSFAPYEAPRLLQVGKAGVFLTALGEGTVSMLLSAGSEARVAAGAGPGAGSLTLTLTKTWYCPDCPFNLISARRIVGAGYQILLEDSGATILNADKQPLMWLELDASGLYTCWPSDPRPRAGAGSGDADLAGACVLAAGMLYTPGCSAC